MIAVSLSMLILCRCVGYKAPLLSDGAKNLSILSIKSNPEVQDAAISQNGDDLSLTLIIDYGTSKDRAKDLGEGFVRLVKTSSDDNKPGKNIGTGIYGYSIGVYRPDKTTLALGTKAKNADHITWH